jgi:hypothetical protein
MMRRFCVFGVVIVAAWTSSRAPHAQTPATTERVWTGTWEEHDAWAGSGRVGRSRAQITYHYVQAPDEFGGLRWASRRLTWSAAWEENRFDYVALWKGPPDDRGFTMTRYREDSLTTCTSGGTLELGPTVAGSGDDLTPAQQAQLLAPCVTTFQPRESGVPAPAPSTTETRELLQVLGMPNDDELAGCAYEKTWPKGGRPAGSFSVSVSTPVTAVMEVSRRAEDPYARFVPSPGSTLTFTASVPSGAARFRFELDPEATSRFPGYATNADIDDAFFVKYNLSSERLDYKNDGPDVIFNRSHFGNQQEWSRIEPLVVETARPQRAAVVTVTTMDYGAVGRLRAFVRSEDCGDWQPVPITFHPDTREFIAIPMDEDNNLMADALEQYHGRQSGADDDAEPRGNGQAGDGLTVFEEYRGFLTSPAECVHRNFDNHVRTRPKVKDLFVHTPDPELEMVLPHFAWSSGVDVHPICERQYSGNPVIRWEDNPFGRGNGDLGDTRGGRKRIVNFTLQFAGLRQWQGHVLSQELPQHGLYLIHRELPGRGGMTCGHDPPACTDMWAGPPMLSSVLIVDKGGMSSLGRVSTPTHELGHAVGLPHHGWKVENWEFVVVRSNKSDSDLPGVVPPGTDCVDPRQYPSDGVVGIYHLDTFVGCAASRIIARNGENSGNAECPMRYSLGDYREAPGAPGVGSIEAKADGFMTNSSGGVRPWRDHGYPRRILLWQGRFLKYDNSLDHDALGRFCSVNTGTGLNGLPGDQNHAGDSQVACMDHLVVNDNVLRGIR